MQTDTTKPILTRPSTWILAACVALVFLTSLRPLANSEFWTHLAQGRAIAESGLKGTSSLSFLIEDASCPHPTWLYDLAVFKIYRAGGASAIILTHALCFTLGIGFLAAASLRRANALVTAAIVLLLTWLALPLLVPGPSAVSVLWAGFLFWFLSRPRPIAALPVVAVLQLLAVNLGTGYLVTPFLVLLALFNLVLDVRLDGLQLTDEQRRYAYGLGLLFLAVLGGLLLSRGGGLFSSAWSALDSSIEMRYFKIWSQPALSLFKPSLFRHLGTLALLIGALGLITMKQRLPLLITLAAFLGSYLLVQASHLLLWFVALALPFLCMSLQSIVSTIGSGFGNNTRFRSRQIAQGILTVLIVYTAALTILGANPRTVYLPKSFGLGETPDLFSTTAVRTLGKSGVLPERMFHLPYDGGPLSWELPGYRIFADDRFHLYPKETTQLIAHLLSGEPAPAGLSKDWGVDALLLNCTWARIPLSIHQTLKNPEWKLMYFDGTSALLVRQASPLAAQLAASGVRELGNTEIETEADWVNSELQKGNQPGYRPRLAGAAGLFNALGHDAEAKRLYSLLLLSCPKLISTRLDFGFVLLRSKDAIGAEREFNRVLRAGSRNALAWRGLSLALAAQNRTEEARAAAGRAERLTRK